MKARAWSPDVDSFARPGCFVIRVDLPGVPPDAIRVEISDDALRVSGERPRPDSAAHGCRDQVECTYGRFSRLVALPAGAWPNRADARLTGGVLEVRVPVVDEGTELNAWRPRGANLVGFAWRA
ncbi:MAG: hypothetical protein A3H29_16830 [Acidobacteria bacterium RIFCSPLOWO2_02_FULL_67_21]|nr:MAG: hypothetical protein A3H29_16830 [Acidobacteria bacterium RIFCSPLOWO2_02_FULL_67_21]